MIKVGSIITLNGKYNYNVLFETVLNGDRYILLSNVDNIVDTCFYKNNKDTDLKLVNDLETIELLSNKFKEETEKLIEE